MGRKRSIVGGLFAAVVVLSSLSICKTAEAQIRDVLILFDNIDDTARVWRNAEPDFVCNIDAGNYPRSGPCTLQPPPGYTGGWVSYVVRFGNGGGGWSSGHARVFADARQVWERFPLGGIRGYGWFFEAQFFVDFAGGGFFANP